MLRERYLERLAAFYESRSGYPLAWQEVTGGSQALLHVTPEELKAIDEQVMAILAAYGDRGADPAKRPADSLPIEVLLTVMVPACLLPEANAALRTVQESLRLIAPLAGAGLFVAVGAHVIAVIDAASFAFPVISLLLLRVREPAPHPVSGRWAEQLSAGVRHIWRTVELRHVIAAGAVTTTVFGFAETISYAIASNGLHRPASFVGVLRCHRRGRRHRRAHRRPGDPAAAALGPGRRRCLRRRHPVAGHRAHQPCPAGHPARTARPGVCRRRDPDHLPRRRSPSPSAPP
jgi:hypothetical protein